MNTKEQILEVSLSLFARNGFDAVSVTDIAERIGMTKGALYKHYANKKAILEAIVDDMKAHYEECSLDTLDLAKTSSDDVESKLDSILGFADNLFRYWTEDAKSQSFRHLLSIEQLHDEGFHMLYRQYFSDGPILLFGDLLQSISPEEDVHMLSMELYGPFLLLYNYFDTAEDKASVYTMLKAHFSAFRSRLVGPKESNAKSSSVPQIPASYLAKLDEVSLLKGYLDADGHLTLMPSKKIKRIAALCYLADRLPEDLPMDKASLYEKVNELQFFCDPSVLCKELYENQLLIKGTEMGTYLISHNRPTFQSLVQGTSSSY